MSKFAKILSAFLFEFIKSGEDNFLSKKNSILSKAFSSFLSDES